MSWATVIVLNMTQTRAVYRTEKSADAIDWAEKKELKDYLVVSPGYRASAFSIAEVDALLKQFGDPRHGLKKDEKDRLVMDYLSRYDARLHDADGAARPGAYYQVASPSTGGKSEPAVKETDVEVKVGRKAVKKAAKKGVAKGAKAVAKTPLAPKAAKPREKKGDGLGREGTATRFICEAIVAGKLSDDKILEAARKKFPDNKIGDGYVSWYRNKLRKDKIIKAA